MREATPRARLIAQTRVDYEELWEALHAEFGDAGAAWLDERRRHGVQDLVEFAGRWCYRSFAPGLNRNVRTVRRSQDAYLLNLLSSGHGSVLEHASFTFLFTGVSRVLTHELVRHRPGVAISQESQRYVRLDEELAAWTPEWVPAELRDRFAAFLDEAGKLQAELGTALGVDDDDATFAHRKKVTSFVRRVVPSGAATSLVWTANVRTLRHVIEARTAEGAEEEIRYLFSQVGRLCCRAAPDLFEDFAVDADGQWIPMWSKV